MMLGVVAGGAPGARTGGWSPALLPSRPGVWYDDTSAVTNVSGACSRWDDISGHNWHMAQATAANRPLIVAGELNGRRVLRFDGTNDILRNSDTGALDLFRAVGSAFMFGVYKKAAADVSATERALLWWARGGSTTSRVAVTVGGAFGGANVPVVGGRRLDTDSFGGVSGPGAISAAWAMVLGVINFSARTASIYINGGAATTASSLWTGGGNTSNTASNGAVIGGLASEATTFDGDIAAVMAGASIPGGSDIDRLFGWAAWRYGLVGSLPVDHPYKGAPP